VGSWAAAEGQLRGRLWARRLKVGAARTTPRPSPLSAAPLTHRSLAVPTAGGDSIGAASETRAQLDAALAALHGDGRLVRVTIDLADSPVEQALGPGGPRPLVRLRLQVLPQLDLPKQSHRCGWASLGS